MTLEEKARLYLVNKFGLVKNISVNEIERNEELSGEFHAYIDGVTENGIVWHDLRNNPDDVPDDEREVMQQGGVKVTYINGHWRFVYGEKWEDDACVYAWIDIPVFLEGEE